MIDLDFKKMAIGVEKRLDEIFADDRQTHNPNIVKFKYAKPPSLASLRNIIKSLEWEVTDNHLNDLMQELLDFRCQVDSFRLAQEDTTTFADQFLVVVSPG